MELKKALITDIIDLKKICIDAYSQNFYNHWNDNGLEWYLNNEFSTERLTLDLAEKTQNTIFIKYKLKGMNIMIEKIAQL